MASSKGNRKAKGGESHGIVVVGGGICGLATALALHRKGLRSLMLEKYGCLREDGGAIGINTNGQRALEQLGVAKELREKTMPLTEIRGECLHKNKASSITVRIVLESSPSNFLAVHGLPGWKPCCLKQRVNGLKLKEHMRLSWKTIHLIRYFLHLLRMAKLRLNGEVIKKFTKNPDRRARWKDGEATD